MKSPSSFKAWLDTPLGNCLGHILEGLLFAGVVGVPIALVFGVPAGAACGWLFQAGMFLGRERRDHEIAAGLDVITDWWRGWNPLTWSADGQRDLFAPIIFNGVVAAGVWMFF